MQTQNNAPSETQKMEMRRTKWPDDPATFKLVDLPANTRIVAISQDMPQNRAQSVRREAQAKNTIIHMRRTKFPQN